MIHPTRRTFVGAATLTLAGSRSFGQEKAPVVIDAHTHFYDPTRPEGIPWPGRADKLLYRPVLPNEFRRVAGKHGVTATIVVEASPRVEDNQWLLDLAKRDKVIVGVVGRLDPASDRFPALLGRFVKDERFRGIRIGHDELRKGLGDKRFVQRLGLLAKHDRQLDVNGGPEMPADVARLTKLLPDLRVVVNHAANLTIDGKPVPRAWTAGMRSAAGGKRVWCKVSALVEGTRKTRGDAPTDPEFYRPVLDALWDVFGEDRLIYGSNWPVSDHAASYATLFGIVDAHVKGKGAQAREKFFRKNAEMAYGLKPDA